MCDINYDKLLDEWAEELYRKANEVEKRFDKDNFSYKRGKQEGYINGLIMATSILSTMEKKCKNNIKNGV